jgi:hypothetical protein
MRIRISLCLILGVAVVGCGVQRGRFTATGGRFATLESRVGGLNILEGCPNSGDGGEQDLLYTLILGPVCQTHGSSVNSDYGTYVTTESYTWSCERITLSVSIRWDRQTDTVYVGKQEFSRSKSDLLVVRIAEDGTVSSQQLIGLGSGFGPQRVLDQIRQQLTNDETVASLKLLNGG